MGRGLARGVMAAGVPRAWPMPEGPLILLLLTRTRGPSTLSTHRGPWGATQPLASVLYTTGTPEVRRPG